MESTSKHQPPQQQNESAGVSTGVDLWTMAAQLQSQQSETSGNQSGAPVSGTDGSAAAQAANQLAIPVVVNEKTFVFVGDKQSGKSSLIAKLLDEPTKDDMRETTALDFRFGTRLREDKKQKINIYELGGGRTLSQLLHAPINAFSVASGTLVICIVIDLANPGASIDTLLFWLASLREEISKATQEIVQKLPPAQQQQFDIEQQRIRAAWEKHDDRSKVQPMPVSVVVIGSKFDIFANQFESIKKKQVCLALRYICHANGCDLVFASIKEKLPAQYYKSMLNRYLQPDVPLSRVERDQNQPLNIYATSDTFAQIGEPEGSGNRRNVAFEKLWQDLVESQIPKNASQANKDPAQVLGDMRRYVEDKVDAMRQQKDEELEQYKKEIERAKRFDAQKAGGVASGQTTEKIVVKRKVVAAGTQGSTSGANLTGGPQPIPKRAVNRVVQ